MLEDIKESIKLEVLAEIREGKAKLGSGKRFSALAKKVKSKALAAWIGMQKYGKKKMAKLAAAGRKRG